MAQLDTIVAALQAIAPLRYAEAWDNVGLLWGEPDDPVQRVLLANDCTAAVLEEASARRCELLVAYHPPLFRPLRRLLPGSMVAQALRRSIAVYSPHTAWDAAPGGSNDVLCEVLGLGSCRPLVRAEGEGGYKLVVFVPAAAADGLAAALAAAGAGRVGAYQGCQYRLAGVGIFTPGPGSQPSVGRVGERCEVVETRIEMVVAAAQLEAVVAALHAHHPYQTPAFDLIRTHSAAPVGAGAGRLGRLPAPLPWPRLVAQVKAALQLPAVLAAAPARPGPCQQLAVVAGAGASLWPAALAAGAEVLVTGEMSHHEVLAAQAAGLGVICTLHSHSERPSLPALAAALRARLPQLAVDLSQQDHEPWQIL